MSNSEGAAPDFSGSGPVEYRPAEIRPAGSGPTDAGPRPAIEQVQAREEARLLAMPGVTSVGIGFGPPGREALVIGITDAGVAARLPREIDGVPLVTTITGPVNALPQR